MRTMSWDVGVSMMLFSGPVPFKEPLTFIVTPNLPSSERISARVKVIEEVDVSCAGMATALLIVTAPDPFCAGA